MILLALALQLTPTVPMRSMSRPVRPSASTLPPASGDIDALVQSVMMQNAQDADDELRDEMNDMSRIATEKREVRAQLENMKRAEQRARNEAAASFEKLRSSGQVSPSMTVDQFMDSSQFRYASSASQQGWAHSLVRICPKAPGHDQCLALAVSRRVVELQKK